MTNSPDTPDTPESPPGIEPPADAQATRRAPSPRVTAALAAAMLALGVVVGAAIGPAPSPSFAVGQLLPLLPSLLRAGEGSGTTAHQPPATIAQAASSPQAAAGTRRRRRRRHRAASTGAVATTETTSAPSEASAPAATTPKSAAKPKTAKLPAITKVWLIELANSSFGELAAHAASAPFIETSAVPSGTLLSGFSALEASAFANDVALGASSPPQLLDTIVQPPCPEGAAGASCAAGTAGALATADEFLKATLPTITSTAAYRESGLVVVTFASIASATATGLPPGASTATLTSQPPAGALLISPFVAAGAKSTATLNPTSPKQSMEKLLRR